MDASTPTPAPPQLERILAMHSALRRSAAELEATAVRLQERPRPGQFARLGRWFHFIEVMLESHSQAEDKEFFPALAQREAGLKSSFDGLEGEHRELHQLGRALEEVLARAGKAGAVDPALPGELVAQARKYREALGLHLDHEEAVLVPSMPRLLTVQEANVIEGRVGRSMPPEAKLTLPWVWPSLSEADRARISGGIPLPFRLLMKVFHFQYRRLASIVAER